VAKKAAQLHALRPAAAELVEELLDDLLDESGVASVVLAVLAIAA
jgi:hypothetical protein